MPNESLDMFSSIDRMMITLITTSLDTTNADQSGPIRAMKSLNNEQNEMKPINHSRENN